MDQTKPGEKHAWHSPEIVDVGGVVETTGTGRDNVADNHGSSGEVKYNLSRIGSATEVDLEGR